MKNVLTLTAALLYSNWCVLNAQNTFALTPVPSNVSASQMVPDTAAESIVKNLTFNPITIKWERTVINITPGCHTQICDPELCYAAHVSTKTFPLAPSASEPVTVHFINDGLQFCCALVHLKLTNLANPADTLTGIYLLNNNDCATGTADIPLANVRLFPNPVTESFSLEHAEAVRRIRVFSLDGRQVALFDAFGSGTYSLSGQTPGTYLVALEDRNGKVFQAVDLVKN